LRSPRGLGGGGDYRLLEEGGNEDNALLATEWPPATNNGENDGQQVDVMSAIEDGAKNPHQYSPASIFDDL
jgi:hypothetical protein